nr:hypothetical protein [Escherichia coli]
MSDASTQKKGLTAAGFKPLVMPPKTSQPLKANSLLISLRTPESEP